MTCAWPGCERTDILARGLCQRCNMRARRAGRLHEFAAPNKECACCGREYAEGTRAGKRFCSDACRRDAYRASVRQPLLARTCVECGAPIPIGTRADADACSTECQQAGWYRRNAEDLRKRASQWKKDNRAAARDAEHRRRARLRGSPAGAVDLERLWARDCGVCWICDLPIDRQLRAPDPGSLSVDHVIPVARGGGHTESNTAIAHLLCNIRKKDRVLDKVPAGLRGVV